MSWTVFFVIALAALAACGILTAWLAGRLGRSRFGWWVIGTFFGPLALPPLFTLVREARHHPLEPWLLGPPTTKGVPRVLAVSGSGTGLAAAAAAVSKRLGWMNPAVDLAIVADAEHGRTATRDPDWERVTCSLFEEAERTLAVAPAQREVLFGEFAPAVAAHLSRGTYALAALGSGRERRAAARLVLRTRVPLLVPGRGCGK
ncbi:MAG: hypothetical protein WDA71_06310 [Actinomycetota bacterium]